MKMVFYFYDNADDGDNAEMTVPSSPAMIPYIAAISPHARRKFGWINDKLITKVCLPTKWKAENKNKRDLFLINWYQLRLDHE